MIMKDRSRHQFFCFFFPSRRSPFKVMATGTSSRGVVATAEEAAPLPGTGLANGAFHALHPAVTTRLEMYQR